MGLRAIATSDLNAIVAGDFGVDVHVINPGGLEADIIGFTTDIGQVIDADTGQIVSGRLASIALSIKSLYDAGLALPTNVPDSGSKPWRISFLDSSGNSSLYKVIGSHPDRALGIVTCELELYAD